MTDENNIQLEWKFKKPIFDRGVVIASDRKAEWIIPWWWVNYQKHNDFPILIVDLGMSKDARNWCRKIGTVVNLDYPQLFVSPKELVPDNLKAFIKKHVFIKDIWSVRKQWFKKPFAMLQTPFRETVWLDLDTEILGNIEGLFKEHKKGPGISMVAESSKTSEKWKIQGFIEPGDTIFNNGVIVYDHGNSLILDWAKDIILNNHLYCGTQQSLCHVIRKKEHQLLSLPKIYNWRMVDGYNSEAIIIHRLADSGKYYIANKIKNGLKKNADHD